MTYADINKMFTAEVSKYLARGYHFNTASMSGSQGETAQVDLTNGTVCWPCGRERERTSGCGLLRQHDLE